jgi:hypothetical protein
MEIIMATSPKDREPIAAPSDWQGWQRWVEDVDWSDWRSWLRRVASTDCAVRLTVRAYEEDEPGDQVHEQLAATWPAFHRWWCEGANTRPTTGQARPASNSTCPNSCPRGSG